MLQSMSDDVGGKPYAEELPGDYGAGTVIFEWLDYFLSKTGLKPTIEALRYYESMESISLEAREDLEGYLLELDAPEESRADLDVDDHSLSLVYVAQLAGMGDCGWRPAPRTSPPDPSNWTATSRSGRPRGASGRWESARRRPAVRGR